MNFAFFYHSLVSDWNHGNAHFLRGVATELQSHGHEVAIYEPADGWSRTQLINDHGTAPIEEFHRHYPTLRSITYSQDTLELEAITDWADVVLVHEWNEPWLVNEFGRLRRSDRSFRLLFHDTHHRALSDPAWLDRFALGDYDGILAFGEVLREVYQRRGWHKQVWTWHEAADTRVFAPQRRNEAAVQGDVVWIGNWGDDERSRELDEFLFSPSEALQLPTNIYGVHYPQTVLDEFERRQLNYRGWLANFHVPAVLANHRLTVHIPRRWYSQQLPGIPTIRPFEAMACATPLICAPWQDSEGLFEAGRDYLLAQNSAQMQTHMRDLLLDPFYAAELALNGYATIHRLHTCAHRVRQLLGICATLGKCPPPPQPT